MSKKRAPTEEDASEATPADFESVIEENVKNYGLTRGKLVTAVGEELTALAARKIAEDLAAGRVALPRKTKRSMTW